MRGQRRPDEADHLPPNHLPHSEHRKTEAELPQPVEKLLALVASFASRDYCSVTRRNILIRSLYASMNASALTSSIASGACCSISNRRLQINGRSSIVTCFGSRKPSSFRSSIRWFS